MERNRVVMTGLGVLAANGLDVESFWRTLLAGESGIGPITLFDAHDLTCRIAGELPGFDPAKHFDSAMKPRRMGRFSQMALIAAKQAFDDARLDRKLLTTPHIPIVMGVSTSAMDMVGLPARAYTAVNAVPHACGSAIAYAYHLDAQLLTVSDGCASSLDAIALAAGIVRGGHADLAITGGSDGAITRYVFECMSQGRKLSTRNDDPRHASRPFDRRRDGGVAGEGAGIVILENLEHALARGVRPYAEIAGYGSWADPCNSEEGGGMGRAMQLALTNAGRRVEEVDHINAHGPGDPHMDALEARMIKQLFGRRAHQIPVTSIKGATGNPMGAGGVLQTIAAALSLRHGVVPPTANFEEPDPECDLDIVSRQPRRQAIRSALVNTHGFGRGNSSLLLRRFE